MAKLARMRRERMRVHYGKFSIPAPIELIEGMAFQILRLVDDRSEKQRTRGMMPGPFC